MKRTIDLFEIEQMVAGKPTYKLRVYGQFYEDPKEIPSPYCLDIITNTGSSFSCDFDTANNFFNRLNVWFEKPTIPECLNDNKQHETVFSKGMKKTVEESYKKMIETWQSPEWRKGRIDMAKQLILYFENRLVIVERVNELMRVYPEYKSCQIFFEQKGV